MQKIIQGISDGSILHLDLIEEIGEHSERVTINTYPDPDLIRHDRFSLKEYFLEDDIDLSSDYSFIVNANLEDYGFVIDGDLHTDLGDERGLSYEIEEVNERQRKVTLRGILQGDYSDIDMDAEADICITGLLKSDYVNLSLYKELAIDAYLLESENNIKMAFFTYFSAMEAIIRSKLDVIQLKIHTELHDALEHLALDLKVKIVAKESFATDDLKQVPIWGEFQGLLREVKKIRNLIAHGKLENEITVIDLNKCIACYVVLFCFTYKNLTTFETIIKAFKK